MIPPDVWEWEAGEIVAPDADGSQRGVTLPVDFSDEPPGRLAAAAPDMARALPEHGSLGGHNDSAWHTRDCWDANYHERLGCTAKCRRTIAALRKAEVAP